MISDAIYAMQVYIGLNYGINIHLNSQIDENHYVRDYNKLS